jgi:hypothetical protein
MFKVAVDGRGRFGNNLIQYFAAKIFSLYFGHNYILNKAELNNPCVIPEADFLNIIMNRHPSMIFQNDVFLEGFFQNISFLSRERQFIKSLFTVTNTDLINYHHYEKIMVIKNLVIALPEKPCENDLVLHIRLDDFIHQGHNSNILDVNYYINEVVDSNFKDTVWIVVDRLNNDFDKNYIEILIKKLKESGIMNIRLHQKSFLEDWTFCMNATNFISSNSTFALTAILLGNMKYVVLPTEVSWKNIVPIDGILNCKIVDNVKRINQIIL